MNLVGPVRTLRRPLRIGGAASVSTMAEGEPSAAPSRPGLSEQRRRAAWWLEGWRLALMAASLLAMTGMVFAVFLEGSPALLSALRLLALLTVLGVLLLSLRL
jgi:hypothetical protein